MLTNKSLRSKKKIFTSLGNLINNSTFHGIPNIYRADKSLAKLIWLFFTLGSAVICIYYVREDVNNYLSFNYVTNVYIIYEQTMKFPAVSICSCSNRTHFNTPLRALIIKCMFNNDNKCQNNPESMFDTFSDPFYKKCYRFNSGKNMLNESIKIFDLEMAGRSTGFQLEMNETNGLLLFIHNQSLLPYQNENYNNLNGHSIFVSTGFSTDLVKILKNLYN